MQDYILKCFARRRLIIVGDIIVDDYRTGEPLGLSAETPTIVARHLTTRRSLGGAALMVRNVLALGGSAFFVSLTGDDDYRPIVDTFQHPHLAKLIAVEAERSTTVKSRFWVNGYKLLQWDYLDYRPASAATIGHLLGEIRRRLPECDALVVSDYRHGLLTPELAAALVDTANHADKPIYVDSQVSQRTANHAWYAGATLFCVNEKEAISIDPEYSAANLPDALFRLKAVLNARSIVLKRGAQGCCALLDGVYVERRAARVQPIDTTGAGDAFFAALSLSPTPITAQHLVVANAWAGLSTTTNGPEPPDLTQLTDILQQDSQPDAHLRN